MMGTIYKSSRYVASLHPVAGLIVQSVRTGDGVRLPVDHPQHDDYVNALKDTDSDTAEKDAICRALAHS